jgi:hypothetical protein
MQTILDGKIALQLAFLTNFANNVNEHICKLKFH